MTTETEKLRAFEAEKLQAFVAELRAFHYPKSGSYANGYMDANKDISDRLEALIAEQPAAQEAERPFVDIPKLRMALSQLGIAAPESSEQLSAQASDYIDDVLDAVIAHGCHACPSAQEAVQRVIDKALALIADSEEFETEDGLVQAAQLYRWHELEDALEKVGPAEVLNYTRPAEPAAVPELTDKQCIKFIAIALRHVEYAQGTKGPTCDDIRLGLRFAAKVEG